MFFLDVNGEDVVKCLWKSKFFVLPLTSNKVLLRKRLTSLVWSNLYVIACASFER